MAAAWPSSARVFYLAVRGAFEGFDIVVDAGLYRRGRFITTVARWLSLGFRLHEGTVEVRSRPGQGTLFSVRLPRGGSLPAAAPG